jgi:hypothetical protein
MLISVVTSTQPFRSKRKYLTPDLGILSSHFECFECRGPRLNVSYGTDSPITVATRSKAGTLFARSNTGIVGSNPIRDIDVCPGLFCVCVVLCVGSGLVTG